MENKRDFGVKNGEVPPAVAEFAVEERQFLLDTIKVLREQRDSLLDSNAKLAALKSHPSRVVLPERKDAWVEHGEYVHAADYTRLEQECALLGVELEKTELRALKFYHQINAHVDLYRELKAQHDAALKQVEGLHSALQKFADLGIESGNSKWPELDDALACCDAALVASPCAPIK